MFERKHNGLNRKVDLVSACINWKKIPGKAQKRQEAFTLLNASKCSAY